MFSVNKQGVPMSTKTGNNKFDEFVKSPDTVRVFKGEKLIFSSREPRLLPLLEYARRFAPYEKGVTVCDRVVGNAAALLLKKILCGEVYSPLGSEAAIKTLDSFGIKYHFTAVVDCIMDDTRQNMCPMEKMAMGKTAEEFYQLMSNPKKG
jgi:hypothetical protein